MADKKGYHVEVAHQRSQIQSGSKRKRKTVRLEEVLVRTNALQLVPLFEDRISRNSIFQLDQCLYSDYQLKCRFKNLRQYHALSFTGCCVLVQRNNGTRVVVLQGGPCRFLPIKQIAGKKRQS